MYYAKNSGKKASQFDKNGLRFEYVQSTEKQSGISDDHIIDQYGRVFQICGKKLRYVCCGYATH